MGRSNLISSITALFVLMPIILLGQAPGRINVITGFNINGPVPADSREVIETLSDTSTFVAKYEGLKTYVKDVDKEYRFSGVGS